MQARMEESRSYDSEVVRTLASEEKKKLKAKKDDGGSVRRRART
jgi:hypothetical protein